MAPRSLLADGPGGGGDDGGGGGGEQHVSSLEMVVVGILAAAECAVMACAQPYGGIFMLRELVLPACFSVLTMTSVFILRWNVSWRLGHGAPC